MRFLTPLAALVLLAAPAAAQNASTAGAIELYPTMQAVGVRLAYTGDANLNATAHIEWRVQGAATWQIGVDMTRITNSRWAGSVLWLDPGTAYDVRAVITDPDGGGATAGTVRTRPEPVATAATRTWWVATDGSDAAAGDATHPLATLQAAANLAQPGEEIRVRPGIYYQTLDTPRAGTAASPITLVADAPGVRVDGSDPAMLQRSDWQSEGGGIYSVPYAGSTLLVCADSLQRLYHQADLTALQSNGNGVAQGFTIAGGRLYAKLEDGSSPNGHVMHVARYQDGFYIQNDDWTVGGFEMRYFGSASGGAAIHVNNASGTWIWGNTTLAIGGKGIWLRGNSNDNLVERNLCVDPRISTWPWAAGKNHDEEIQGISAYSRRGNVIRFNTCRGTFDGIDGGDTATENDGADMDIHDNYVTQVADDALEIELFDGINCRVWHNRVDNVYSGFSISPNYVGPMYVLYNVITNYRRGGFKFSISSTGETWICHNTLASNVSGAGCVHPSGPYSNKHFRNNVMWATGVTTVDDAAGQSGTGCDFDGDLHYANFFVLFRWKGIDYATLAALHSATGFETNGRTGDALFASAVTGDYSLLAGSPAIDAALRMPGINDRFNGAAPDIGAIESGGGPDVIAPA
ncbi:MAG: right-handed parallel beta-helix repeat-containing protein, partial [Candidatus Eisenbacteria bacterium]|nr:right-handed parallel beta-helix repeat-containing protein [Candidatus Eisenbacteria bacterium]